MSTIKTILTRAMNDPKFAEQLLVDMNAALAEYNLTTEELSQLSDMALAEFTTLNPEERKSFSLSSTVTVRGSGYFQVRNEGG
jgi:hypothetical protein